MYNVGCIDIGKKIKEKRKQKNYTLQEIGNRICKSKSTILKYENGEIIPDIITLLDICNAMEIKIQDFVHEEIVEESNDVLTNSIINLFKTSKLYLYYLSHNRPVLSSLEFDFTNKAVRMCNDIKKDKEACLYYYEGNMEFDNSTMYINLTGRYKERGLEIVQIIFKILILNDIDNTFCFVTGLTPNGTPLVKKGIIKSKLVKENEMNDICRMLTIDKKQAKEFSKYNSWLLKEQDLF